MSSRVNSSRAKGTGWRKFGDATSVPSRIVDVAAATAATVGTAANPPADPGPPIVRFTSGSTRSAGRA